jgi:hypothetical protein
MKRTITSETAAATGALEDAFACVQESFERFCLAAGMEALGAMMEADVGAIVELLAARPAVTERGPVAPRLFSEG